MALNNTALHAMLSAIGTPVDFVSLHTALPNASGSNEVVGGSYTREGITWNSPSSGSMTASNSPVFDVPASTTITHLGLWDASTSGTYYGSIPLSASEEFTGAGTYTLTSATLTAANA